MPLKPPNLIDVHVGKRIRHARVERRMSTAALGKAIGLTGQQIEKYERGVNRIGASRIQHICTVLEIAPSFLFEDAPGAQPSGGGVGLPKYITDFPRSPECIRLVEAFGKIRDKRIRQDIARLVTSIADSDFGAVLPFDQASREKPESNDGGDD